MSAVIPFIVHHRFAILTGVLCLIFFYQALKHLLWGGRLGYRRARKSPGYVVERPWAHIGYSLVMSAFCLLFAILFALYVSLTVSYQPIAGARKVATLSCQAGRLTIRPLKGYPGKERRVGVPSRQWAVRGVFVLFHPALSFAGLRSSHRMTAVLGRERPEIPDRSREMASLDALRPFADILIGLHEYLPLVTVKTHTSPYLDSTTSSATIYAFEGGYSLLGPGRGPK